MADTQTKKSLRQAFEELPLRVRDWLTSERVTYFIIEINNRLGVDDETIRVIPRLILRLVVRDLEPNQFIHELGNEMDLPFSAAKVLAQEIEEKILRPIEAPLRLDVGVDIKLMYIAEEKTPSPILEVLNEAAAGQVQPATKPMPVNAPEKLIATAEAAHPSSVMPAEAGIQSGSQIKFGMTKPAPMPRVEPLPVRPPMSTAPSSAPFQPATPSPTSTSVPRPTVMPGDVKKTTIPFKFEPSRVPKFPNNP